MAASVIFSTGVRRDVVLFCPPGEDIGHLLSSPEPFLPIELDGKVRLVARKTIAVITAPLDGEFDEEGTLTRRMTVTVRLAGGGDVEGELAYTPRPGRPRVLDFLNEPDSVLRVLGTLAIHHVSKQHIESVEER